MLFDYFYIHVLPFLLCVKRRPRFDHCIRYNHAMQCAGVQVDTTADVSQHVPSVRAYIADGG